VERGLQSAFLSLINRRGILNSRPKIAKNRACKAVVARLRFALFLGKTLKFVAVCHELETIDLWQLKFA
jgi:hypothetical protein